MMWLNCTAPAIEFGRDLGSKLSFAFHKLVVNEVDCVNGGSNLTKASLKKSSF